MSRPSSARIHPTAIIAPEAVLGEHVEVGAYAIIEGPVTLGSGCVIRPQACLYGPLTMGRNNTVFSGAVLGECPQHLKYNGEPTSLDIGDDNIFREHVTIHRGTTQSMKTTIGSKNFFMVNSHVAHDCVIGDNCFLTNGCMLGGHCVMEDQAILSGNSVVHQYTRIGRLSLLSGVSGTSKDIPPFMIQQGYNSIYGVNVVGMRRAGMNHEQIDAIRTAFKVLFRDRMLLSAAIAKLEQDLGAIDAIQELVTFLRGCTRGINAMRSRMGQEAA